MASFLPPPLSWSIIDSACLDDAHVDTPGFYLAATSPGTPAPNVNYALYESVDDGENYIEIARSGTLCTMGRTTTAASILVGANMWDDVSSIDVIVDQGELETVTDLQCQNGANRAVLGHEVIGYVNAELIAYNKYRLTRLLRGLQGTEEWIPTHFIGDRFICISNPGIEFVGINTAAIGQDRLYKCVPEGGRIADYTAVTYALQGATVRPLSPVNVTLTRDSSNNATIAFTRRGRGVSRLFGTTHVPPHEGRTAYYVDVMDSADPTIQVRRTAVASNDDLVTSTYSAANQTTDGYTPGDPINLEIRQYSSWLGTGSVATVTA